IAALAYAPDGSVLATATGSWQASLRKPNEVRLWDARTGAPLALLQHQSERQAFMALAFDPSGNRLAATDFTGKLWIWEVRRHGSQYEVKRQYEANLMAGALGGFCFSRDGRQLVLPVTDQVRLWDVDHHVLSGAPFKSQDPTTTPYN